MYGFDLNEPPERVSGILRVPYHTEKTTALM